MDLYSRDLKVKNYTDYWSGGSNGNLDPPKGKARCYKPIIPFLGQLKQLPIVRNYNIYEWINGTKEHRILYKEMNKYKYLWTGAFQPSGSVKTS